MIGIQKLDTARHTLIRVVAFAAALVLIALVLRAKPTTEGDANTPLAENPFARAAEGDWATYVALATENGRRAEPEVFATRIIGVSGDRVRSQLFTKRSGDKVIEGAIREHSASRAPTVAELLAAPGAASLITNVTIDHEKRSFEGKKLRCTRVTFDRRAADSDDANVHVVAWVSDAIPGGIVAVNATGSDARGNATTLTWELAGFGAANKVTAGRTLEQIPPGPVDMIAVETR